MLRKAIATMVIGCMIGLSFGAMSRDSHAGAELEVNVLGQRPLQTLETLLEAKNCNSPVIGLIGATRTQMAMGAGGSTAAYIAARDATQWLVRCRAAFDWAFSVWNQTPEGRAYLARVAAHKQERLRLECECEGVWIRLDPAFANGGAFAETGEAILFECSNCAETASVIVVWDPKKAWDNLTPAQKDFLRSSGALALATLVAAGVITGPQAALIAAYLAFEWHRVALMRERGTSGGGQGFAGGGTPERPYER